jgi:hypothetical protein
MPNSLKAYYDPVAFEVDDIHKTWMTHDGPLSD